MAKPLHINEQLLILNTPAVLEMYNGLTKVKAVTVYSPMFLPYTYVDGLSLLNEDGGLRVFFPRNSFVTNTTLTRTNSPRMEGGATGNDHIACYGGDPLAAQVTWHDSSGGQLLECRSDTGAAPCRDCGGQCQANGAVGQDRPVNGHTDIHMYTDSSAYVNQDLECQVSGGQSAFIGVYLKNGGEMVSLHTSGKQHNAHSITAKKLIVAGIFPILSDVRVVTSFRNVPDKNGYSYLDVLRRFGETSQTAAKNN